MWWCFILIALRCSSSDVSWILFSFVNHSWETAQVFAHALEFRTKLMSSARRRVTKNRGVFKTSHSRSKSSSFVCILVIVSALKFRSTHASLPCVIRAQPGALRHKVVNVNIKLADNSASQYRHSLIHPVRDLQHLQRASSDWSVSQLCESPFVDQTNWIMKAFRATP